MLLKSMTLTNFRQFNGTQSINFSVDPAQTYKGCPVHTLGSSPRNQFHFYLDGSPFCHGKAAAADMKKCFHFLGQFRHFLFIADIVTISPETISSLGPGFHPFLFPLPVLYSQKFNGYFLFHPVSFQSISQTAIAPTILSRFPAG